MVDSFSEVPFTPNVFIDILKLLIKINALRKYSNVMREHPHPRSEQMIKALASYRVANAVEIMLNLSVNLQS